MSHYSYTPLHETRLKGSGLMRTSWVKATPRSAIILGSGLLAAALCSLAAEPPAAKELFAKEKWYKDTEKAEQTFEGVLRKIEGPMATSGRWNPVRLVISKKDTREVYLGGKTDILDAYLGSQVIIVGKPMEVLGHNEIWPARVWAAPAPPEPPGSSAATPATPPSTSPTSSTPTSPPTPSSSPRPKTSSTA